METQLAVNAALNHPPTSFDGNDDLVTADTDACDASMGRRNHQHLRGRRQPSIPSDGSAATGHPFRAVRFAIRNGFLYVAGRCGGCASGASI